MNHCQVVFHNFLTILPHTKTNIVPPPSHLPSSILEGLGPPLTSPQYTAIATKTGINKIISLDANKLQYSFSKRTNNSNCIFNPLKHQQGIWSLSRLQQYYPLYSGISSHTPSIYYSGTDSLSSVFSNNPSLSSTSSHSSLPFRKNDDSIKESTTKHDTNSGICLKRINKHPLIHLSDDNLLTPVPNPSEVDRHHQTISSPISPTTNITKVPSMMFYMTINPDDEEKFTRPTNRVRKCKALLSHPVEYLMQNKNPSTPFPSNSLKDTSNTIVENITPDYSRNFRDEIVNKSDHMTRVLYQNTGSLRISSDSRKFEVICGAMYDNEVDIGYLVETNTHWQHKRTLPKINQVMRQFWSRNNLQTAETITPCESIYKPSGSLMISTPNLASRITDSGEDSEGLGRWSNVTYDGKNKV